MHCLPQTVIACKTRIILLNLDRLRELMKHERTKDTEEQLIAIQQCHSRHLNKLTVTGDVPHGYTLSNYHYFYQIRGASLFFVFLFFAISLFDWPITKTKKKKETFETSKNKSSCVKNLMLSFGSPIQVRGGELFANHRGSN